MIDVANYEFAKFMTVAFTRLYCGFSVEGRHHVPASGGCLLLANHISALDPPVIGAFIRRPMAFLARSTLFDIPLLGPWIRTLNAHPIERGASDRRGLVQCVDIVGSGSPLLLFPEGTRSPTGELQPFQRGFLLIVKQARVPVVPVGLRGLARVLPKGAWIPRPRHAGMRIGAPIGWREALDLGHEGVRDRIAALLDVAPAGERR